MGVEYMKLIQEFYKAAYVVMTKSRSNLWLSCLMQMFFYIAQFLFWEGIGTHQTLLSSKQVFGFFITMAIVDNAYLVFFGPGSILAQQLILGRGLEQILTLPRHPLFILTFAKPNLAFLPCLALSVLGAACYFYFFDASIFQIVIWIFSCILGIAVLNAISFIYRLSAFWTAAIVQVRNSNPSFKIMVRPFEAFHGKIRFVLLTIFPALFITGIPSEILNGTLPVLWFFGSIFAVLWLYGLLFLVWNYGVRRYMLKVA